MPPPFVSGPGIESLKWQVPGLLSGKALKPVFVNEFLI